MSKKSKMYKYKEGFTIIEVLIAISLVAFSLIAILNAFIFQNKQNNVINDRNIAVMLAEEKIEDYFKYPYDNMPSGTTDYVVYKLNRDPMDPITSRATAVSGSGIIFERIVSITQDFSTSLINVRVNYGYDRANDKFKFSVNLSTRKGS